MRGGDQVHHLDIHPVIPAESEMVAARDPVMDVTAGSPTSGRPPPHLLLIPRSEAHAAVLRAASLYKEAGPPSTNNRSLSSAHIGTRINDSANSGPPEPIHHRSSPPLKLHGLLLKSASATSTTSEMGRKFHCDSHPPSSSLRQRPSSVRVKLSLRRSTDLAAVQGSPNVAIPPPPPPPSPSSRTRIGPSSALKITSRREERHRNCHTFLLEEIDFLDSWDRAFFEGANTDVTVHTNDGHELAAHSTVLMCSSPVLKRIVLEQFATSPRQAFLHIRGVPFQAVRCFVRFLYSSRCERDDMEEFALHLLVLAHAYMVPSLKRLCADRFEHGLLNFDNVVDVLQVARLCDASRLYLLCLRRIVSDFKAVARSDGWRIMTEIDPTLEQELVGAVVEAETERQGRVCRLDVEGKVYAQLRGAMEALVHICRDGCRLNVGSDHDKVVSDCSFPACKGLEYLVRHFSACKLKVSGGCVHCQRMWQILELHSRMCTSRLPCKVPLCRHFRERVGQQASRKEEMRWKMLVRKVHASKTGAFPSAAGSALQCR